MTRGWIPPALYAVVLTGTGFVLEARYGPGMARNLAWFLAAVFTYCAASRAETPSLSPQPEE